MDLTYTAGPMTVDGGETVVLGQWSTDLRWNGWITPDLDAWTVEAVLAALASQPDWEENGYSHEWVDGDLVLRDHSYPEEGPEVLSPDADGLYDLGAFRWCWSSVKCQWCGEEGAEDSDRHGVVGPLDPHEDGWYHHGCWLTNVEWEASK